MIGHNTNPSDNEFEEVVYLFQHNGSYDIVISMISNSGISYGLTLLKSNAMLQNGAGTLGKTLGEDYFFIIAEK